MRVAWTVCYKGVCWRALDTGGLQTIQEYVKQNIFLYFFQLFRCRNTAKYKQESFGKIFPWR